MGGIFSKRNRRRNRNEAPPSIPPKQRRGSLPRDTDDLSSIPLQQMAVLTSRRPLRIRFRTREEILSQHESSWRRQSHPAPSYLNVDHRTQSRTIAFQNRGYGYVERVEDEDVATQGNVRRPPRIVEGRQISHPSASSNESSSTADADTITVVVEPPTPDPSDQERKEAQRPPTTRKFRRSLKAGLELEPGTYRFKVHKRIVVQQKD